MRILFAVLSPLSAELGASQMALNLGNALRALGAEVVVWTPQPVPPEIRWWRRMGWMRERIAAYVREDGDFDVVDVPPVAVSAELAKRTTVIARSVQPDLVYLWTETVHAGSAREESLAVRIAGACFSLYLAVLVIGGWFRAKRILCLGHAELAWMRRWFPWWRRKLLVYMNAIGDGERAELARLRRQRKPQTDQRTRFLWLGRWAAHKGVDLLLEFAVRHLARAPNDRITIAGCGPAAERHIPPSLLTEEKVRVVPAYSRQGLLELLEAHDAGLFTSRAEGWGLTLQEMLEAGMPVYATGVGAVCDLATHFPTLLRKFPPPVVHGNWHASAPSAGIEGDYLERFSWRAIAKEYLRMLDA